VQQKSIQPLRAEHRMNTKPLIAAKSWISTLQWVWRILRTPLFVYIGLILMMTIFEDRLVFQPTVDRTSKHIPQSESPHDKFINHDDYKLHGILIEHERPLAYGVYFHGNGGNISHRRSLLANYSSELQISILGISYSGYGKSGGIPGEQTFYRDSELALAYLLEHFSVKPDQVMAFGESMGGAVAMRLAARHGLPLLALDSTFTSLPDVGQANYPWLPVRLLMRNRFPTTKHAAEYHGRVIQTHGTDDSIVPYNLGRKLAESFPRSEENQFIVKAGGDHNEMPSQEYFNALKKAVRDIYEK